MMTPEQFKAARAILGLTQVALGRMLHCHPHHISHIEIGLRKPSETLCELLRMKIEVHAIMKPGKRRTK